MTATSTSVKICGISTFDIYRHCAEVGVDWIGMVFYARSPRHLEIEQAAALAAQADRDIAPAMRPGRIALVVDADDASLNAIIEHARPDILQLHGHEPPARIAEIKQRFGLPVMPVITVSANRIFRRPGRLPSWQTGSFLMPSLAQIVMGCRAEPDRLLTGLIWPISKAAPRGCWRAG